MNKRVAFPLSKDATAANVSPQPLNLPPTIPLLNPVEISEPKESENEQMEFDPIIEKERILRILNECAHHLTPSVQSNVKTKLKNLEDEWDSCDLELQKMLVELAECNT